MTSTEYRPRSQDEIVARIEAYAGSTSKDYFGFRHGVLVAHLDFEHAQPYLKDGVTTQEWAATQEDLTAAAQRCLKFAISKVEDHRGISADRSVQKLEEYAWLLGRDDVVAAMEAADYPQYGAPKVKAFADGMGWPWPADPDLARMAQGLPCSDDCYGGCGT